jgi:hypothetical protein
MLLHLGTPVCMMIVEHFANYSHVGLISQTSYHNLTIILNIQVAYVQKVNLKSPVYFCNMAPLFK